MRLGCRPLGPVKKVACTRVRSEIPQSKVWEEAHNDGSGLVDKQVVNYTILTAILM